MTATEIPKVSLKLLIDTKNHRVIFAEASKDFIDFLFNILSLPLATVINIVSKELMVGSLSNLYQSIENLNQTYILPSQEKETLLKPKSLNPNISNQVPLLPLDSPTTPVNPPTKMSFYKCTGSPYSACSTYVTDDPNVQCPTCNGRLAKSLTFVGSPAAAAAALKAKSAVVSGAEGGFVKGVVTYMVMDDLVVTPLSMVSSITLLNKLNVKDIGVLEERVVEVGMDEGVKLLKESLQSRTVLTNVFIEKINIKVQPVDD